MDNTAAIDSPDTSANAVAETKVENPEQKPMSAREAGQILASLRKPKSEGIDQSPTQANAAYRQEMAAAAEARSETPAQAEDDAPPIESGASDETAEEPEQETAIEPPRSWTKEARERWSTLPRETQEYLAERERERDRDLNRRQQEAAEQRKAMEAERQQVEQARQSYESALPQLMATLQAQQMGAFADVKTLADVERLAAEDWPRYLQWDLQQKKIAAVQQELVQAQQRQQQERQKEFQDWSRKQDESLLEKVPEMGDTKKAAELREGALKYLTDTVGFDREELAKAWNQKGDFSLRDHRVQMVLIDAARWRDAQEKRKTIVEHKKPVPPVARPGTAPDKNVAKFATVQPLLEKGQSVRGINMREAAKLMQLRRSAARKA